MLIQDTRSHHGINCSTPKELFKRTGKETHQEKHNHEAHDKSNTSKQLIASRSVGSSKFQNGWSNIGIRGDTVSEQRRIGGKATMMFKTAEKATAVWIPIFVHNDWRRTGPLGAQIKDPETRDPKNIGWYFQKSIASDTMYW